VADAGIRASALTGDGIAELRVAILRLVSGGAVSSSQAMVTNLRQQQAVMAAIAALVRAGIAGSAMVPHEMVLLDLYEGLQALDSLTGATTSDDVLHLIFSRFCIGK
jgi:tRNA modification GTPase